MAQYRVNNNADIHGDHEVHSEGCHLWYFLTNYQSLGDHGTCYTAVAQARTVWPTANGCIHCSPACHTR